MCTSPRVITVDGIRGTRRVLVGCGKCAECVKEYQNAWLCRFVSEFKQTYKAVFFTLTYSNEHVPTVVDEATGEYYLSVCKSHVQDWIKRFRTNYERSHGEKLSFKYFICSEYGPKTQRPHYHGVLFGVTVDDVRDLFLDWSRKFGFVKYDDVYPDRPVGAMRYVSKYCSKGIFESPFVKLEYVCKTFRLVSKMLGSSYAVDMADFHRASDCIFIYGRDVRSYHNYSDAYLGLVRSRMFYKVINSDGSLSVYKLPKYYVSRIFGRKQKVIDKQTGKYVTRIKSSTLQFALSDFAFAEYCRVFDSQLASLQASHMAGSEAEATNLLYMQTRRSLAARDSSAQRSLKDFYTKSVF